MSGPFQQQNDHVPWRLGLGILGAALLFGLALTLWAWGALVHDQRQARPSGRFPEEHLNPPHTVANVREGVFALEPGGRALNDEKRKQLDAWGWADREKRIVRVPIERAIDQVAGEERR